MDTHQFHSPAVDELVRRSDETAEKTDAPEAIGVLSDVSPEAKDIGQEIATLTGGWNPVEFFGASNYIEQRNQFFAALDRGEEVVPVFEYSNAAHAFELIQKDEVRDSLMRLRDRIHALPEATEIDRIVKVTLLYKVRDDLATCDMVAGIATQNDAATGIAMQKKYPGTDEDLLSYATAKYNSLVAGERPAEVEPLLSADDRTYLENLMLSPEEQAEGFIWALKQYGLYREGNEGRGFRVVLDPSVTTIDVRDKSKDGPTVFIPTDRDKEMNAMEFCSLIAHEIESHACQAMNGEELFGIDGGTLRKDDETMYEGLAIRREWDYVEKYFGKPEYDIELVLMHVFAVQMAENGASFVDIFKDQLDRRTKVNTVATKKETGQTLRLMAFKAAYRCLRGHTDMTNAAGFAMQKDLAYLRGWLIDKELVKQGKGYMNEAAIASVGGLKTLSSLKLQKGDAPHGFLDVAPQYHQMLLTKRRLSSPGVPTGLPQEQSGQ